MLPAANTGCGMNIGFPDVCLTPPGVPIPYPNFAYHCMAVGFSVTTRICMLPAIHLITTIPVTFGMEPGVLHPLYMDVGTFVMGSPLVFIDGAPGIHLTNPTMGNAGNNAVGAHVVPNAVNVFYTDAAARSGAPRAQVDRLAGELVQASLREGGVAHLTVRLFGPAVSAEVWDALRRLEPEGLRAVVIDLRGNPGGELDACAQLAGDFLERDTVVVRWVDEHGDEEVLRARSRQRYLLPAVVLVDEGTASAAELFAGALQEAGRALVVGAPTHGKSSAQGFVPGEQGARYATVAACTLADGRPIPPTGLQPDVRLSDREALVAAGADLPPAGDDPGLALACWVAQDSAANGWT